MWSHSNWPTIPCTCVIPEGGNKAANVFDVQYWQMQLRESYTYIVMVVSFPVKWLEWNKISLYHTIILFEKYDHFAKTNVYVSNFYAHKPRFTLTPASRWWHLTEPILTWDLSAVLKLCISNVVRNHKEQNKSFIYLWLS